MKNRITAVLLVLVTIVSTFAFALPTAAADDSYAYADATSAAKKNAYATVADKVAAEVKKHYTYLYAQNDRFELYCNKFTGEVYLKNRLTETYLTTNPIDIANNDNQADALSQIWFKYKEGVNESKLMNSYTLAATKGQITVHKIRNGIRVEYVMGDTASRILAPESMHEEDFKEKILRNMQLAVLDLYTNLTTDFSEIIGDNTEKYASVAFAGYNPEDPDSYVVEIDSFRQYVQKTLMQINSAFSQDCTKAFKAAEKDPEKAAAILEQLKAKGVVAESATALPRATLVGNWLKEGVHADYMNIMASYGYADVTDDKTGESYSVWSLDPKTVDTKRRSLQNVITEYNPDYTIDEMLKDEKRVGYVFVSDVKPVFRCAIEYVLDAEGMTFSVPANSIVYDESRYTLSHFSVLRYFGAGETSRDGYVFYPDGSGALFMNKEYTGDTITKQIYGYDYAYRDFTATKEQTASIYLPVYGAVKNEEVKRGDAVVSEDVGYVAIITEGDSMTKLNLEHQGSAKYLSVYQSYEPRPGDRYTLGTATGSGMPITASFRYTGNYTTKIVMLTDPAVQSLEPGVTSYNTDYVGMAKAYRNYLINTAEVLSELTDEDVEDSMPLYIESFGTIETVKKILTFPTEVNVPLTTFDDVATMHGELSGLGISNIKFRLSGFYNGGVEEKYPTKLKLQKDVGGKKGFNRLLAYAEKNEESGMEVFLNADFLYNYRPGSLGGPSMKKYGGRSMDDRYASKQTYDTVFQGFFSSYAMTISADKIDTLFAKFNKKFSKFDADAISLDYFAEDLSSNFDEDVMLTREDAKQELVSALAKIKSKYANIMSTGGNAYALKYVDHLLRAPLESSRYFQESRIVPFYGLVMHGTLQYTGSVFNEAGNPDYEILRAIESGAALYFVLCYNEENINLMKDDNTFSKYYATNYHLWKENLVKYYDILDYAIGDLQTWQISDHRFLSVERAIKEAEEAKNLAALEAEYLALLTAQIKQANEEKGAYLRRLYAVADEYAAAEDKQAVLDAFAAEIVGGLDADVAALIAAKRAADETLTDGTALAALVAEGLVDFTAKGQIPGVAFDVNAILADAQANFNHAYSAGFAQAVADFAAANTVAAVNTSMTIAVSGVENYKGLTACHYFTASDSLAKDYEATDYTLADGSVALVTYSNGTDTVRILLNFSIFTVNVTIDGVEYQLEKYDFIRLDARADGKVDPR